MDIDVNNLSVATFLMIATSVVIPLCSALLSRANWPQEVTGILTLLLSAVSGFVTEAAVDPDHYSWGNGLVRAAIVFILAILSHYGLWKDTTTQRKLLEVGAKKDHALAA